MFDTQQFVKGNVPPTKYLLDLELLIPDSIRIKKLLKKKVLPYFLFCVNHHFASQFARRKKTWTKKKEKKFKLNYGHHVSFLVQVN